MADASGEDGMHLPLRGVVLCCTSIQPEIRSQIASMVIEMGADHKLDLTSDVTHMIVGELQTPKYKYVAKEREDVQCLTVDWVYAVREQFLSGGEVAVDDLEQRYKVPTFWNLVICITGFEDPEQRKELELQIAQHGGEYRGDLRKDCSHLVCFSPAGAKYSSAKAWGIHTVSIEWLSMSIQRGLVLDEEYFKPIMLPEERGTGAWIRRQPTRVDTLKRDRNDGQFGRVRKLRRTASERANSDNIWGDIVSAAPSPALGPTDSFADIPGADSRPATAQGLTGGRQPTNRALMRSQSSLNSRSHIDHTTLIVNRTLRAGIFYGKSFFIDGFEERRVKLLEQHLNAQDARVYHDQAVFQASFDGDPEKTHYTIVPYTSSPADLHLKSGSPKHNLVNELWLEKCLHERRFIPPSQGTIYEPFNHPLPGFAALTICSTGLDGVNLMHLSKVINLLGASYHEGLNPTTSLLLCNDLLPGRLKVKHAIEWGIPVLRVQWLWDCIKSAERKDYKNYLCHASTQFSNGLGHTTADQARSDTVDQSARQKNLLGRSLDQVNGISRPTELAVKNSFAPQISIGLESQSAPPSRQVLSEAWQASESLPVTEPLREVSPNISRLASQSSTKQINGAPMSDAKKSKDELNAALTSLLHMAGEHRMSPTRKQRQLFGRAQSDLSTRSLGSRADSVDSMNTDGLGTPLEPAFRYSPSKTKSSLKPPEAREEEARESLTAELLLSHEEVEERERQLAEEQAPVLTQVGYDDSEAGVWRERLSRKIAGMDANEPPSPEVERELENARRKKVLKDEGRQNISARTRHNRGA